MAQAERPSNSSKVSKPGRSRITRPRGFEWVLISLAMLYAGVLLLGPLLAILWGALANGISELIQQFASPEVLNALKLTLLLSVGATLFNTVFGLCIALVLARDNFRGQRFLNGLVDLPFAVSPVIVGFMILLLFGRNGWFTNFIDALNIRVVFALPGMLLATTFVALPFVVRELVPVLRHAGMEQEHAAYTLGASPWRTFREITLPNIAWGLLYGISLTFARSVGEFGAVLVVGGGVTRLSETATLFIYRALDDRNETGAYAMALVLAALSLSVLLGMEHFKKRLEAD